MHVHYRPADHVLDHLSQVEFVAVVGPTGSGKTTLVHAAMDREPRLHKILNNTSRAPRPAEHDGVDYRFLSKETMQARIKKGGYVQVAPTVLGDLYATAPEDYVQEGVAVLEVLAAAVPVFRGLPFKSVRTIYTVPPSWEVWQERMQSHRFTPEQLQKRLAEARQSLQFALHDEQLAFVINDTVSRSVDDFIALAFGKPMSGKFKADQTLARHLIRELQNCVSGLLAKGGHVGHV